MEAEVAESVRFRMESIRLICEKEVPTETQKVDSFTASFCKSLDSVKARAEETVRNQVKFAKLKHSLREAEDEFVQVIAEKTRKEAKQMTIRDSISAIRTRMEELNKTVQVLRARRDEYAAIISQHCLALAISEGKENKGIECKEEIQEAMLWYNNVLGFEIEGGRGVKFIFKNINIKSPDEEYSFSIRHENNIYALLACDPHLKGTEELIHELNRTNGLFKFVRMMREKFQEAASLGILPQSEILHQEISTISMSAPVLSVSTEWSESSMEKNKHSQEKVKRHSERINHSKGAKKASLSPLSVRRSPRFTNKK